MMKTLTIALCMVLVGVFSAGAFAAKDSAKETEIPGTIHVFNGKDLTGFYTFIKGRGRDKDPEKVFTVKDGMLRISGQELGCVTSVDEFENYRLIVEFKWGEVTHGSRLNAARDSGVLVHSVGADGGYGDTWMHSIECQVIEGGTGDFIVVGDGSDNFQITCPVADERCADCPVFQPDGKRVTVNSGRVNWFGRDPEWKDVKGFRGKKDVEKPVGEWNRYECVAQGDTLTVILNGVTVNQAFNVKPSKGRIQIQSEFAEIFVRRVDVVPLGPPPAEKK